MVPTLWFTHRCPFSFFFTSFFFKHSIFWSILLLSKPLHWELPSYIDCYLLTQGHRSLAGVPSSKAPKPFSHTSVSLNFTARKARDRKYLLCFVFIWFKSLKLAFFIFDCVLLLCCEGNLQRHQLRSWAAYLCFSLRNLCR